MITKEEAQLIFKVMDKLAEGVGNVAPGDYGDFYADLNTAFIALRTASLDKEAQETGEYWKQRHADLIEMAKQDREELAGRIAVLTTENERLKAKLDE